MKLVSNPDLTVKSVGSCNLFIIMNRYFGSLGENQMDQTPVLLNKSHKEFSVYKN